MIIKIFSIIVMTSCWVTFGQSFRGSMSSTAARYENTLSAHYSQGARYAIVPWIKEYLYYNSGSYSRVAHIIDDIVLRVGANNFINLREDILKKNQGDTIYYIYGKKLYKLNRYKEALVLLDRVKPLSIFYPQSLYHKAVIEYLMGNLDRATTIFKQCYSEAKAKNRYSENSISLQYKLIQDLCLAGTPRSMYAKGQYEQSDYLYLDLDKRSRVWPSVLYEEAWSSYYQQNYNRTLGKLVTYKAPLLTFRSMPEHESLKAVSYMRMCLYDDVNKVVDDFYREYEGVYKTLQSMVGGRRGPDYYYNLLGSTSYERNAILRSYIEGINKNPSVIHYQKNIEQAQSEMQSLRSQSTVAKSRTLLAGNLQSFVEDQRKVIGQMVRNHLQRITFDMRSAFESMSYIRLEILAQKKSSLYKGVTPSGKRGDIKYLKRNDKQYFWTFNGEFWVDELGDYVFALPSEC